MKKLKKLLSLLMVAIVAASMLVLPSATASAATDTTVKLSSSSLTVAVGEARTITLKNAEGTVKWSSSDSTVATVKAGKITGKKTGTATITAKYASKSYSCKVTITRFRMTGRSSMEVGDAATFKVIGRTKGKTATWSTSDASVATVSKNGKVTAHRSGTVKISVKIDGLRITKTVKIKGFSINVTKRELSKGQSLQLKCTDAPKGTIVWTSSNTAVATVTANGKVKAVAKGKTTITATAGGKKATCIITVTDTQLPVPCNSYPVIRSDVTIDDIIGGLKKGMSGAEVAKVKGIDPDKTYTNKYTDGTIEVKDSIFNDDGYTVYERKYDFTYGNSYMGLVKIQYYTTKSNGLTRIYLLFSDGVTMSHFWDADKYKEYYRTAQASNELYDMLSDSSEWSLLLPLNTTTNTSTVTIQTASFMNDDMTAGYTYMFDGGTYGIVISEAIRIDL